MDKKIELLNAFRPISHSEEPHEEFRAIFDCVYKRLENLGIFDELLPLVEKAEKSATMPIYESTLLFKQIQHHSHQIYTIIHEEKEKLRKQMHDVVLEFAEVD